MSTELDTAGTNKILSDAGLTPEDWVLNGYRVWGPEDGDKQVYVAVVPKKPEGLVIPARMPGDYQRKAPEPRESKADTRLVAYLSDQHCPYHDERLHELTCEWLAEHQPSQVVLGGDLVEFDTISRHRSKPQAGAVQKGIDSAYGVLRDYVQATPASSFQLLPGNHCVRLQNLIVDQARELYGIKKGSAGDDQPDALSLESLLRCDELGVTYVNGTYENAQVQITPSLAARHGWLAYKGAGRSAMRHLEVLGHSIIHGHTHRQGLVHRTIYSVDGIPSVQVGIEAGAMCQLDLAKSYSTNADWQNGFVAVTVFPDGRYHPEFASYVKGELYWRGERYN